MKQIISYTLYGDHRRYWASIPFILIANELIHPEMITRFHISPTTKTHPCFKIIDILSKQTKRVEYKVIEKPFIGTEPTTWRLMPIWDKDVEYVFCRDIDAVPSSAERKAVLAFKHSKMAIHGIRSWWTHTTTLMAGLCGFDTKKLRLHLGRISCYEHYRNFGIKHLSRFCTDWQWGCDQHLLHRYFLTGRYGMVFRRSFLDSPLGSAPVDLLPIYKFKPVQLPKDTYDSVSLEGVNQEILAICDNLVKFLGEPVTVESVATNKALNIDCETSQVLRELFKDDKVISDFYGIGSIHHDNYST